MADFKVHEIDLDGGHFDIDIGFIKVDNFAQEVLLTLNTWKNEFAYDVKKGLDYDTIMRENFSSRSLEAFLLFNLKRQLQNFDTFDNYKLEYDKLNSQASVSFIAYSTTGQSVSIDNFTL